MAQRQIQCSLRHRSTRRRPWRGDLGNSWNSI